MIKWLVGQQQEPKLDESRSPPRLTSFIASEIEVDAKKWRSNNISHRLPTDRPQHLCLQHKQQKCDMMRGQVATQHKNKEKAKAIASLMEREEQLIHSNSETKQSGDDSSSDGHRPRDQGGSKLSKGQEIIIYKIQPQDSF